MLWLWVLPSSIVPSAVDRFAHPIVPTLVAGKYTALLAVLIVGSFIIPMAQYFWYVKDDDSSDRFFAQNNAPPPPPEKPKKKGWF
jgi:hypothetical protein